jgi:hypothetical protein
VQLLDKRLLVFRQNARAHLVDAELRGDGVRGAFVVAGRHDDAQSRVVQRP